MCGFRATVALCTFCKLKHRYHHGGETRTGHSEFTRHLTTSTTRGSGYMDPVRRSSKHSMKIRKIVKALRYGDRRKASDLLLGFAQRSPSLRADDFLPIFKRCAQSCDPLFVMETWRLMEAKNISLNDKCVSLMTQTLCKGGYLEEAFNMVDFLGESHDFHPVPSLYNFLLTSCVKEKNIIHARKCLELMEKQMAGKNEITYIELLKLAVLQENLSAVHLIWEDYIKNYRMSMLPLMKFIHSFTALKDLKSAYKTLQHMVSLAIMGNIGITRKASGSLFSARLDIPVPSNRDFSSTLLDLKENEQLDSWICPAFPDAICASVEQEAFRVGKREVKTAALAGLNREEHSLLKEVLIWSFDQVLYGCRQHKNYELVQKIMLQMQDLGLDPSRHAYDCLVRTVVSQRHFKDGIEILKKMKQNNLKPLDSTLAALSVSCSHALELDLAEALLNQIAGYPHLYPYGALLAACDEMDQPERALRVFAKMKQIKLVPDIRIYENLFSLFGTVNAPYENGNRMSQADAFKRINAIERDMAKNGIQHSHISMKNLLKALGEEGMIRELFQYLHVAENLFIYSNSSLRTEMYNTVLHYLVEARESHMAIEIFKKMKKFGFHTDSATYDIMIDCCSITRCFKSASLLVSMMIRKGFHLEICTYTSLIKILMENENFSEALNLLERAKLGGIQLDVLLFNTFLRSASYKRENSA
ncbi:pentatricopeptide repeat-containing protein At1g76280 isoform X2 [Arachis duranensis]|uniref:Pentatricopeptide repeat-containing protein At1g76280 isoform X2 n=1 Tax=Arachis duranensis TaxID=130453 RepID=A0A9C6TYH8_ARADU|nr:pentatricopeptide repeat-containing protein At1g76280 isoform X2 [Arachis duranensis]